MCIDCGCQEGNEKKYFEHTHADGDTHSHANGKKHHHHEHPHTHKRTHEIVIEKNILAHNDEIAANNKEWLKKRGVITINIISSPGAGKTYLLEKTLDMLKDKIKCAVIVGDQQTDNDAKRLVGKGAKVKQIETYSSCHLNAEQIQKALPSVIDDDTKILFIENIGNLVCPAAFELGEDFKIAILSTTEGEDKPIKYPVLFNDAKVVIISKTDLIPYLDWNLEKCREYINKINPSIQIFELSAKTNNGMDKWIQYLSSVRTEKAHF